ncbi:target of rapamycin complex 2 subunit mapkap1 [Holotrichia oblita]|uniref:Target of rapamycin complex 2 subunit mapkap1 n=1 Tax=Holotrichia oblita TaxID=644536 RepID=A0ACB9SZI1_HOLOL|nr:target of rapamycin complex 2 subunit mapkap1 [Holotrichia oblita]
MPRKLIERLDSYTDPTESDEDEDEVEHESYDLQFETQFGRHRTDTAQRIEKMDQARKRAAKIKHVKWEESKELSETDNNELFSKKVVKPTILCKKSLLADQLEKCENLPRNPYIEYAKFDGSAQIGIPTRKYKIFLTMLPEEQRNYPMTVCCIAAAKIEEFIGLILLKCSTVHGDIPLKPVTHYGLYLTEDDGEVDRDFPCLDSKECVAKFSFTYLSLVEHKNGRVSFDAGEQIIYEIKNDNVAQKQESAMQESVALMEVHKTTMESQLYKSFQVHIINKVRSKVEIHLGISGEKIEIDPVQQKSSKFALVRQKAVSHHMDSVVWCDIIEEKSKEYKTVFRIIYSLSYGTSTGSFDAGTPGCHNLHNLDQIFGNIITGTSATIWQAPSSTNYKHYDFDAEPSIAKEIVQKVKQILEVRSSASRKEYMELRERKSYKRKNFNINK